MISIHNIFSSNGKFHKHWAYSSGIRKSRSVGCFFSESDSYVGCYNYLLNKSCSIRVLWPDSC